VSAGVEHPVARLERLYAERQDDIPFDDVLREVGEECDDVRLAEVIEADGRRRILRGFEVSLDRYLESVHDLRERTEPLDAAVEMTLRSLSGSSRVSPSAVDVMVRAHPDLAQVIHEAATLTNVLWSTNGVRESLAVTPILETPCDFGHPLDDGRPRYAVKRLIGHGSAGSVYLANDRRLAEEGHEALVALKLLAAPHGSAFDRLRRSDEATRARRINHANVVRIFDRGSTDDGTEYVVSEFVEGGDLAAAIERSGLPIPQREAAKMIALIARGVQAAHSAGLVHCDLKPGNIILTDEGEPKVADFGLAAERERGGDDAGDRDAPLGNIAFIAPEQFRMEPGAPTPQSDLYAIGGMLFYLLTDTLPNGSSREEIEQTHDLRHGRPAAPLFPADAPVDRDLKAICSHALAPSPADRYDTVAAFADDLERWLERRPIGWTKPTLRRRTMLWARRYPALAAASIVLFAAVSVAGTLGLIVTVMKRDEARREGVTHMLIPQLLDAARTRASASQNFYAIGLMRSLMQQGVYGARDEDDALWQVQKEALAKAVDRAVSQGRGLDIDVLSERLMLAAWHVADREVAPARAIVDELRTSVPQAIQREDDRVYEIMRCVGDAVRVLELLESEHITHGDITGLRVAAARLRSMADRLNEEDLASGYQFLMLDTLALIYSPTLLGDPEAVKQIKEEIERLQQYSPLFPEVYDRAIQ